MKLATSKSIELSPHYATILEAYDGWLQSLGFAKTNRQGCVSTIRLFLLYLQGRDIQHISHLTQDHLYQYFDYLQARPHQRKKGKTLSASYLNKSFDALDKLCECLHQIGVTDAPSPTRYRILNPYKPGFTLLSIEEVQALYEAIPKTQGRYTLQARQPRHAVLRLILDLCYGCGLRRKEVFDLRPQGRSSGSKNAAHQTSQRL